MRPIPFKLGVSVTISALWFGVHVTNRRLVRPVQIWLSVSATICVLWLVGTSLIVVICYQLLWSHFCLVGISPTVFWCVRYHIQPPPATVLKFGGYLTNCREVIWCDHYRGDFFYHVTKRLPAVSVILGTGSITPCVPNRYCWL